MTTEISANTININIAQSAAKINQKEKGFALHRKTKYVNISTDQKLVPFNLSRDERFFPKLIEEGVNSW